MRSITGDIITIAEQGELDVIVHGCNCFCTMGAGVAKQIRKRYPAAYTIDCTTQKGDINKLGGYTWVNVVSPTNNTFTIVNGYTQFYYGHGKQYIDYKAVTKLFQLINTNFHNMRIGYPYIGAGLGGGDWNVISNIIDKELHGMNHVLVILQ